ncbi:MAG: SAM-dependent chlorinase/fluorinase [Pyrinomonadaceae bacterium]
MFITLLSDFGMADYFVGAVKGAVLSIAPAAVLVDLTHEIPAHDIATGAFALSAAYAEFPAGTIHLAVVDPGVGSSRRAIAIQTRDYFFVGPDNGLFSLIYDRELDRRIFQLTEVKYFRRSESTTFDGRDVFAPVAAHLANGVSITEFGPEVHDPVRPPWPIPQAGSDGSISGTIIHIDHFGNCVTNITKEQLNRSGPADKYDLQIGPHRIDRQFNSYEGGGSSGEPLILWGSAGYLEISMRKASAALSLGIKTGDHLRLFPAKPKK